jgi:hypothetical protein
MGDTPYLECDGANSFGVHGHAEGDTPHLQPDDGRSIGHEARCPGDTLQVQSYPLATTGDAPQHLAANPKTEPRLAAEGASIDAVAATARVASDTELERAIIEAATLDLADVAERWQRNWRSASARAPMNVVDLDGDS